MDIAVHYFAVKTLAVLAGFSDDDAQVIAQNSQMVDDFDFTAYWNCTNVPDYIKNSQVYDLCVSGGYFNPAQTGFLCDGLLGYFDYLNLIRELLSRGIWFFPRLVEESTVHIIRRHHTYHIVLAD